MIRELMDMRTQIALVYLVIFSIILSVLFCGCVDEQDSDDDETPDGGNDGKGGDGTDVVHGDEGNTDAGGSIDLAESNNRFAFDLLAEIDETDKNTFFSPWSIFTAMGMTYEGARGTTADEIRSVFGYPEDDESRRESFRSAHLALNQTDGESALQLANAIWADSNYTILDEYQRILAEFYFSGYSNLDIAGDPEGARKTINDWVENRTNDLIRDLIPPGFLGPGTPLVLTNAIYFLGEWQVQFNKKETEDEVFRTGDGATVEVPMMKVKAAFNYSENEDYQLIELPYRGGELSMLVFLPKDKEHVLSQEPISMGVYELLEERLARQEVRLFLPKFSMEEKFFLAPTLTDMGMPTAFGPGADFSGINGYGELWIQHVIHQAHIEVDEEGTEAGAATAIIFGNSSQPEEPLTFNADHPFLFMIRERASGNILFLGKVVDPTI